MERELERHVPILGWLHVAAGALFVVMGIFVFTFFTGIGVASGEAEAMRILGIVGLSVGSLLIVLGLPGLATGYGLLKRRPWARMAALVLGILNLVNIPRQPWTSPTTNVLSSSITDQRPTGRALSDRDVLALPSLQRSQPGDIPLR